MARSVAGLYGRIQGNNLRSLALFALFFLCAESLTLALGATLVAEGAWGAKAAISPFALLRVAFLASWSGGLWIFHISGWACWLAIAGMFYRAVLKRSLGLRRIGREEHARVLDIVEATAIAAGLPRPPGVHLIDSPARNAFAFGLTPWDAGVALSRGLIDALDLREIEAVVAHEIAHIRARDIRLMAVATLCAGVLSRVTWVFIANIIQPSQKWIFLPMFAARFFWSVLTLMIWTAAAAGICALMARLAISHAREFKADAEAVDITGDPEPLIRALRKLEGRADIAEADFALGAAMIAAPRAAFFSTHPSIERRVAALREIFPLQTTHEPIHGGDMDAASRWRLRAAHPCEATPPPRPVFGQRTPRQAKPREARQESAWVAELRALRPPRWVSHPYILLPAIGLNIAIDLAVGPMNLPDFSPLAPRAAHLEPSAPQRNPALRTFVNPAVPLR